MEETLALPSEKTILIVDDDPEMIKLLELTLGKEGFKVVAAKGGAEATAKLAGGLTPDLIITDLMMPGTGGYEFLRNLQAEGMGSVPIYVVSSATVKPATIEMIRNEANVLDFIQKPIPIASFTSSLHRQLKTMPPELQRRQAAA
jgi:CheY-like chemotaxis protein